MHTDTDTLHFLDDESEAGLVAGLVWRLMVIDDEPDVHRATTFALAGVKILGRSLEFLHAYSASEAAQMLRTEQEVAVVLLDVVMEREDAGLALVKTIRQDLHLTELRIILRTGQPGYAPEIETIHDFDINDYKTKSELTRTKLYATVTAAVRAYEQIRKLDQLAFYDRLCSLPNRNKFIDLSDQRLTSGSFPSDAIAILDIDDFSEINDALGHQQGDRLLQAVAERLKFELGSEVVVARLGGDTFGLMGDISRLDPLTVLDLFRAPFKVHDDSMVVTATMGLTQFLSKDIAGRDALKDANIALKLAKKSRRGSFVMFSTQMGADIRERVRLLQALRHAVESERLFVVYQPQVNLVSGKLVGVEALIRWRNEDGTFVPPDRFTYLPNTAGCESADDAVRTLRLARELLDGHTLVKLEVLGDPKTLYPNVIETLKAAEVLIKEGFDVMVYTSDDPIVAKELENIGCCAIMPLASLIGSGMGILNPWNLQIIIEHAKVPVLVDAGVGTASDAAIAMELGCEGVLMNTAIASANDPIMMASAMKKAIEAGREAYLAGRMAKKLYSASPSSPSQGMIS